MLLHLEWFSKSVFLHFRFCSNKELKGSVGVPASVLPTPKTRARQRRVAPSVGMRAGIPALPLGSLLYATEEREYLRSPLMEFHPQCKYRSSVAKKSRALMGLIRTSSIPDARQACRVSMLP